jgi:hypothetical protein
LAVGLWVISGPSSTAAVILDGPDTAVVSHATKPTELAGRLQPNKMPTRSVLEATSGGA